MGTARRKWSKTCKTIFCWSVWIALLCSCDIFHKTISLGEVTWVYHGAKKGESSLLVNGEKVIGPKNMTLWGEYPYIAGDCVMPGPTIIYFVIDLRTKELKYFKDFRELQQTCKIKFDFRDFVTFQDLSGQWEKPNKRQALIKALQK